MFNKVILTGLLCLGLFAMSESSARAGVGSYCWWCKGADVCQAQDIKGISGTAVKNGTATATCTVTNQGGPQVLCKNPQGHFIAPGQSAIQGGITFSQLIDNLCEVKVNGKCAVQIEIPTEPEDFQTLIDNCNPLVFLGVEPCTLDPNLCPGNTDPGIPDTAQSCFEKFWGTTCNNNFIAFGIFFPDPQIDIRFFDRGKLKDRIQASCHYPEQDFVDANGDLVPVDFNDANCEQQN
jgi:hypothetical protein